MVVTVIVVEGGHSICVGGGIFLVQIRLRAIIVFKQHPDQVQGLDAERSGRLTGGVSTDTDR